MSDCSLNLDLTFEPGARPTLDFYVKGIFTGQMQNDLKLKFASDLRLYKENSVRVMGEMNDIFENAFNLNNMINMTQMTLNSRVDMLGNL